MALPANLVDKVQQLIAEGQKWFVPDCEQTIALMREAIALAQTAGLAAQEAKAQLLLARSFWALGNLEQGHTALDRTEDLAGQLKSARLYAELECARGRLHLSASEYGLALKAWTISLKKALSVKAFDIYADCCMGIGDVYFAHQQAGDALRWHEVGLDFARKVNDPEQLAESYLHVAADLNLLGEYQLVLALSKTGESIFQASQHKAWLADWYSYRGEAYWALAEYDSAKKWLHTAWEINRKTSYLWSQSLNLLNLGKVYVALSEYEQAHEYLTLALEKISSFGSFTLLLRVYSQLSELGRLRGDYKMAWEYRRQYHELAIQNAQQLAKDKLTNALDRRIRELDTQLMVLQTRQENLMLRQQSNANSELMQTLRSASLQDPLTGASNRRHLDQEMPILYQRCAEDGRALSVLMVDLDHFKKVNDTFGHAVGDDVIRSTAMILLQSCRGGDLVARFGGEEFVLLLPGATAATAAEVAERIRMKVAQFDWAQFDPNLQATCSIGVAELSGESGADILLQNADHALYRAKHLGRNRVEIYQ
ncbi:GGDEF domain-containing protein [Chitinibacter bivalviorum]|uniref:diguanylate cyclase n=1 Tax=Chitinibacter bivalviorum TaxID=2739434 RepID=A0A7H9BK73_9NEIS|nr:GGDEF domain-containing protein [Chitinibacter bivalviorum]QLG88889.1 GGDEF domain-containing protein [Chitinibacter bivalviorum]